MAAPARYTEQLVIVVTPAWRAKIEHSAIEYGVSQAEIMRRAIGQGFERALNVLERERTADAARSGVDAA